jgi:hypothetical protein
MFNEVKAIKKLSITAILLFFTFSVSYTQIPLLIKGKVTDEFSGKPVECTVEFRSEDGKKIRINTQTDGLYQQILNSGETYEVYLYNWDVIRKNEFYTVPDLEDYQEVHKDFSVKKLEKGNKVYDLNFFDNNSSSLNGTSESFLKELNTIMRFNRHVEFDIHINAHDTHSKSTKLIKSLVSQRIDALSSKLSTFSMIKGRVNVVADESKPSGKPRDSYPDVVITVREIENKLK